jgi:phage-related protein
VVAYTLPLQEGNGVELNQIYYYMDSNGTMPVKQYIDELATKQNKNSRINYNKIIEYIDALEEHGFTLTEPQIKHIDGDIWELRPIRNRIFFAAWAENGFVLLHHFIKKTRKTPTRESDIAKRRLEEIRNGEKQS